MVILGRRFRGRHETEASFRTDQTTWPHRQPADVPLCRAVPCDLLERQRQKKGSDVK